jgi:hypothetical protein
MPFCLGGRRMADTPESAGETRKFEETPVADFFMGIFLIALCLVVIYAAWSWPRFEALGSAPGLFPFLIAISLLVMAVFLLAHSIKEKGHVDLVARLRQSLAGEDTLPTLLTLSLVLVYIIALLNLFPFAISTLIYIGASLFIFWRRRLWLVLAIAAGMVALYSVSFEYFFHILMPGSAF